MSVKAYRIFRVQKGEHPKLKSVYFDVPWPKNDPMIEAECRRRQQSWCVPQIYKNKEEEEKYKGHTEIAPHDGCAANRATKYGCGIYTALDEEKAREWGSDSSRYLITRILAEVEIWGKTVPHKIGYRSQFCRIKSIIPLEEEPSELEQTLAHEYDIPLLEKEKEDG